MRKKDETLGKTLLAFAREIADREGLEAINIRAIAQKAGVAPGTVYNYFASKDDILLALTEEYWRGALDELDGAIPAGDFCEQLEAIFLYLRERIRQSAGILMGSLGSVESTGQSRMAAMQGDLEKVLVRRMGEDKNIQKDVWDQDFSPERFARFIMSNMMALWRAETPDPAIFLAVVRRILY